MIEPHFSVCRKIGSHFFRRKNGTRDVMVDDSTMSMFANVSTFATRPCFPLSQIFLRKKSLLSYLPIIRLIAATASATVWKTSLPAGARSRTVSVSLPCSGMFGPIIIPPSGMLRRTR